MDHHRPAGWRGNAPNRRVLGIEELENRALLTAPGTLSTTSWTALGPAPIVNGQSTTNNTMPVSGRITGIAVAPPATSLLPASSFAAITANGGPDFVVSGNFTGDSIADLVTLPYEVDTSQPLTLSLLAGHGDGTFADPVSIPLPGYHYPSHIVAGDFNGDGADDLAVACSKISDDTGVIVVLVNDGHGNFTVHQTVPLATLPRWMAVGDFFGDGHQSLAVTNYTDVVTLYQNDGAGTFTQRGTVGTAQTSNQPILIAADLNGDGSPDLALADNHTSMVSVFLNNGTGTFTTSGAFPVGDASHETFDLTAGDFNGDGSVDLATVNSRQVAGQSTTVTVLLNRGNGVFTPKGDYGTGTSSTAFSIVAGNFLGNGIYERVFSSNRVVLLSR